MRGLRVIMGLLALTGSAVAADMPVKAPPPAATAYDWTGVYVGGHIGYAAGSSHWSAMPSGAPDPAQSGSLDLFKAFNGFDGMGSYFEGFQAGYNYMLPSRWLFGGEADVSFPSTITGTSALSAATSGMVSYAETVEFSGTLRGRIGYAPNLGTTHWLFYATGGFAWSYDQFTRTQIAGTPAGGTAVPGQTENLFVVPRVGGVAGAGVELALPSNWTARLEYLFTDHGNRSVTFPAGAQRFNSDLNVSELRFGLNYRLNGDPSTGSAAIAPPVPEFDNFAVHGQTTYVSQYVFPFRNPYFGQNSLAPNQGRETWDATAYLGMRLWRGAELWVNPEIDQGFGLSSTLGVAGFPSGEAYKVGASVPYARIPRYFVRQTIDLGGDMQKVDGSANQFSGSQTANRLVLTVGKFAVTDIFDTNKYAHDPRSDFMNWALIDTGTFDYASDAWGFTYGAAAEWYQGDWTVRGGLFDLSVVPNDVELDPHFAQFQWVGEIERRYDLWGQPGKVAVTGFLSRGRMGTFSDAIALAAATGGVPANLGGAPIHQPRRLELQSRAADHRGSRPVRPRRHHQRQYRAVRIQRYRSHRGGGSCAGREILGPARRHGGLGRRDQRHFRRAPSLSQCRGARHPGRRRHAAASGAGTDRRGLLPIAGFVLQADPGLPVHRQPGLQQRSRPGVGGRGAHACAVLTVELWRTGRHPIHRFDRQGGGRVRT